MLISAHDYTNQFYTQVSSGGWDLGWSSQSLVSAAVVTATGGTYELEAPVKSAKDEVAEEQPKRETKTKKKA